ncbi:hypothetical protein Afil01_62390 [Actinorhabdospora filicis]|uniref:Uncharacterized protein n=1 Tax=Actinorhabdospora filicis TaxID=1785913 RepID=A0A9W6SSE8_9ACTN|nr:hypothetical protein [Actinorhabdospora filicis]GLZ81432.1 hypothetical protein Afil01_62390 [Actinorhabdospora filicis]
MTVWRCATCGTWTTQRQDHTRFQRDAKPRNLRGELVFDGTFIACGPLEKWKAVPA